MGFHVPHRFKWHATFFILFANVIGKTILENKNNPKWFDRWWLRVRAIFKHIEHCWKQTKHTAVRSCVRFFVYSDQMLRCFRELRLILGVEIWLSFAICLSFWWFFERMNVRLPEWHWISSDTYLYAIWSPTLKSENSNFQRCDTEKVPRKYTISEIVFEFGVFVFSIRKWKIHGPKWFSFRFHLR